jgi:protein-disulfide isomerase
MSDQRTLWKRRAAIAFGMAVVTGWVIGAPHLSSLWRPRLTFRDLPGLAPFRELETSGGISSGAGLLAGLDAPTPPDPAQQERIAAVLAAPCAALFGDMADPRLPIAFFSDFNCPNCLLLNATLEEFLAARPDDLRIVRHQLPLLGAASTVASQAALAADLQGGYGAMHDGLTRARMVTDLNAVVRIAESAGLDGQQLVADMQTDRIASALDRAKAVAAVFGFYGTPATVIGRIMFLGNLPKADVVHIIDEELAALPMACPPAA